MPLWKQAAGARGGLTGTLDKYTTNLALAYSTRQLLTAYSGSAIRVRESSGNTEADIGFDNNGNLDTVALLAHTGANSGYVTKWYDQSGNTRDIAEATAAKQPRIVNSGTVDVGADGKPGLVLDGSDDRVIRVYAPGGGATSCSVFSVFTTSDAEAIVLSGDGASTYLGLGTDGDESMFYQNTVGTPTYYKNGSVQAVATRNNVHDAYFTGSRVLFEARAIDLSTWLNIEPCTYRAGVSPFFAGVLHEFILYTAGGSEAGVEAAINAYWGVY